jgi:DNA polymerase/3'-5' exonuclease PolX
MASQSESQTQTLGDSLPPSRAPSMRQSQSQQSQQWSASQQSQSQTLAPSTSASTTAPDDDEDDDCIMVESNSAPAPAPRPQSQSQSQPVLPSQPQPRAPAGALYSGGTTYARVAEAHTNRNKHLTDPIEELEAGYASAGETGNNQWRAKGLKRLVGLLKRLDYVVSEDNVDRLSTLRGVGEKMLDIMKTLLQTGSCDRLKEMRGSETMMRMQELSSIHGIGAETARKLLQRSIFSVADVRERSGMASLRTEAALPPSSAEDMVWEQHQEVVEVEVEKMGVEEEKSIGASVLGAGSVSLSCAPSAAQPSSSAHEAAALKREASRAPTHTSITAHHNSSASPVSVPPSAAPASAPATASPHKRLKRHDAGLLTRRDAGVLVKGESGADGSIRKEADVQRNHEFVYISQNTKTSASSSSASASGPAFACRLHYRGHTLPVPLPIVDAPVPFAVTFDAYDAMLGRCYLYWHRYGFRHRETEVLLRRYLDRIIAHDNTTTGIKQQKLESSMISTNKPTINGFAPVSTRAPRVPRGPRPTAPLVLQDAQRVGLLFNTDHQLRMPRTEVASIVAYVQFCMDIVCPGAIVVCCGSFRRGKGNSGDCDVLVCHPAWEASPRGEQARSRVLRRLLWALQIYNTPNRPSAVEIAVATSSNKDGAERFSQFCVENGLSDDKLTDDLDTAAFAANTPDNMWVRPASPSPAHHRVLPSLRDSHSSLHTLPPAVPFITGALRGFFPVPDRAPPSQPPGSPTYNDQGLCGPLPEGAKSPIHGHTYPENILLRANVSPSALSTTHDPDQRRQDTTYDTTWMGFCRLPPWCSEASGRNRRLDIKLFAAPHLPFALLYFTGSDHFNRSMRYYAKRMKHTLSESALRSAERVRGVKVSQGKAYFCRSEREVFEAMSLEYVEPWHRNVYDIV